MSCTPARRTARQGTTARAGNHGRSPGPGRLRAAAVAALLAGLVLLAAGCSGQSGDDEAMSSDALAPTAEDRGGSESGGESGGDPAAPDSANRASVQVRALIKTGQIAVTSKDLDRTREEVDQLLFALGGSIDNEQTSHDDQGDIERSTLVLRVPVAKFKAAMDALEKLGTMKTSDSVTKNVTTEVIDVNERVQTLQNSLDRLQRFQRSATDVSDLIRYEDQITSRQSELQSLKAQQTYLADQTSMSTLTLHLSTPENKVTTGALDDAGFLAGLKSGWDAMKDTVVVVLTGLGAVLPFAVAVTLVGVPTWLLVRALARRRVAPAPPAEPDAG